MGIVFALLTFFAYLNYREHVRSGFRLSDAYSSSEHRSDDLYELFATFSEADNLFQLYTVDFRKSTYDLYLDRIKALSGQVDSLISVSGISDRLRGNRDEMDHQRERSERFASLKREVDDMILSAGNILNHSDLKFPLKVTKIGRNIDTDSITEQILGDSTFSSPADTVIYRKKNLVDRIFRAKDDTLVTTLKTTELKNILAISVNNTLKNVIKTYQTSYDSRIAELTKRYGVLRTQERELIAANFINLGRLRASIDALREKERSQVGEMGRQGLLMHTIAGDILRKNFLTGTCLLILVFGFLWYYSRSADRYESELEKERRYSSSIAERKTEMLSMIAHDVRSPLVSMKGLLELFERGQLSIKEEKDNMISKMKSQIDIVSQGLEDILNLERLEAGNIGDERGYFYPFEIFTQVITIFRYQCEAKGLRFDHEIKLTDKIEILGNRNLLGLVLSNLLGNATKYTSSGSVKLKAHIQTNGGNEELLNVSVSDTGKGIPQEHLDNLFRKYYKVPETSRIGGVGLGLYISQRMAQTMGGRIEVRSTLGMGSEFTLLLPIKVKKFKKGDVKRKDLSFLPDDLRMVMIDDNPINAAYLRSLFHNFPNVEVFTDPRKALKNIQANLPQFVVTDIVMEPMDGRELLVILKRDPKTRNIPVIEFSSSNKSAFHEVLDNQGIFHFDHFLEKPLKEEELVELLLTLLRSNSDLP